MPSLGAVQVTRWGAGLRLALLTSLGAGFSGSPVTGVAGIIRPWAISGHLDVAQRGASPASGGLFWDGSLFPPLPVTAARFGEKGLRFKNGQDDTALCYG